MDKSYFVVYCTCPDQNVAEHIARTVVAESLAACVNILPNITSVYRWKGEVQRDEELLLIIKTRKEIYPALETRICELHPYEVVESIALPIAQGTADYLNWIDASVREVP